MFNKYWIKKVNQSFVVVNSYDSEILENYNYYINSKLDYVSMQNINDLKNFKFLNDIIDFCNKYSYIVISIIENDNNVLNRYTCWNGKVDKSQINKSDFLENIESKGCIVSLFIDIDAVDFLGNSVYKYSHIISGILVEKIRNTLGKSDIDFINLNSNYLTNRMGYNVNELLLICSFEV